MCVARMESGEAVFVGSFEDEIELNRALAAG